MILKMNFWQFEHAIIIMQLYKYNLDDNSGILLHEKIIYIYEAIDGEISIDEQVDYSGSN